MDKRQIARRMAKETGLSGALSTEIVDNILTFVGDHVLENGGTVTLPNMGKFYARHKSARTARDFQAEKEIPIAARTVLCMSVASKMKESVRAGL